jgi:hypothetical protein
LDGQVSSLSFQGVQNANLEIIGLSFVQMDMAKVVVERFGNVKKCFQSSNGWKFEANLERSKKVFKSPIWKCQKRFIKNLFNLGFQFQAF